MLFSATQTNKIDDLARISLKKQPLYVGVDDKKELATVAGLEQVCIWKSAFVYLLLYIVTFKQHNNTYRQYILKILSLIYTSER